MPHKRNPITCERLCGLARVLRANLGAGLEDVALWHERDISHSSVERVVLPDSTLLAYYVLVKMRGVVEGMKPHPERMAENLERSLGLLYSQPVLLALVAAGVKRDTAYRVVQQAAAEAWIHGVPFRSVLESDSRVDVDPAVLDEAFSLQRALRNSHKVLDALDEVDV
jgi:adenylosuccinate lyase